MKNTTLVYFADESVKWCDWIDFDASARTIILRRDGNAHRSVAELSEVIRIESGFRNEKGDVFRRWEG